MDNNQENCIQSHEVLGVRSESMPSRIENLEKVKTLLAELRSKNPEYKYPPDEAIDDLTTSVASFKPMVFSYVSCDHHETAVTVGVESGPDLEIRWVFSNQPGGGIELIKNAMKTYDKIKLKVAPYGYKEGEQSSQLEKIVKYYKALGFSETNDSKDEKYGGTIPMVWQFNKLMGGR